MIQLLRNEIEVAWLGLTAWSGPNVERGRHARSRGVDFAMIACAICLPWSTAATSTSILVFVGILAVTGEWMVFFRLLMRPVNAAILPLCIVAIVGMFWASDTIWPDRLHGLAPLGKLLVIPALVYQFRRSTRGAYVFFAFVASCAVLMIYSWTVFFFPDLSIHLKSDQPGIPVKNYIDQSQGFAFCVFALAAVAIEFFRAQKNASAIALTILAAFFLANMAFVNVSRTTLLFAPVLALLLAFRYFHGRKLTMILLGAACIFAVTCAISSNLQRKISTAFTEYSLPATDKASSSVGQRLDLWKKSIAFIEAAPLVGHGTGSNRTLFERDRTGNSGPVIANPHNQTLLVAIQWGLLGVIALYAMWGTHLATFCIGNLTAWIGLVAVTQNILSSLFNSHLFDYYQGWLYVISVGVAGGTLLRQQSLSGLRSDAARPTNI